MLNRLQLADKWVRGRARPVRRPRHARYCLNCHTESVHEISETLLSSEGQRTWMLGCCSQCLGEKSKSARNFCDVLDKELTTSTGGTCEAWKRPASSLPSVFVIHSPDASQHNSSPLAYTHGVSVHTFSPSAASGVTKQQPLRHRRRSKGCAKQGSGGSAGTALRRGTRGHGRHDQLFGHAGDARAAKRHTRRCTRCDPQR